ncbi:CBS domain-containing protein [Variovorax sp. PAMC26660]|uniref:CBS domain-containing protein n=1 Tax=Variovorax sp. PAMC26660 TaxID=2762322 RepID=UPI00164E9348|nr:CBS domain-containing protein [Variovorax sp. PAMC26660]QNK68331.1 CBS domain-containing protein [Variovorax sp. PAMC26660]
MKPVSELLKRHDSAAWRTSPHTSVFDALATLAHFEVGALMVMDGEKLVGFLSERDYTRKVALQGKNSKEMKVSEIMTPDVMTVTPQTRTRACMTLMSQRKFRHLPVVDGEKVVGMISIQDLMDDIISDHEATIEQLTTYIQS